MEDNSKTTKVLEAYVKLLYSAIPIERRAELVRVLQNMRYSPEIAGLIVPDLPLENLSIRQVFKLWNAYNALLLDVLQTEGRDELMNRFSRWLKLIAPSAPEDVVNSILNVSDYTEVLSSNEDGGDIIGAQGVSLPKYPGLTLGIHEAISDPSYYVGLRNIDQVLEFDAGLKALHDSMAGALFRSKKRLQHKDIRPVINAVIKDAAIVEAKGADVKDVGEVASHVSDKLMKLTPDEQVNYLTEIAKVGQAIRLVGEEIKDKTLDAVDKKISTEARSALKDRTDPSATASAIAQNPTQKFFVYDSPKVGVIIAEQPIADDVLKIVDGKLLTEGEGLELVDLIHSETSTSAEMSGDIHIADLLMMGHKISGVLALRRLMKQAGSPDFTPVDIDFTVGDVIVGDLVISKCLRALDNNSSNLEIGRAHV